MSAISHNKTQDLGCGLETHRALSCRYLRKDLSSVMSSCSRYMSGDSTTGTLSRGKSNSTHGQDKHKNENIRIQCSTLIEVLRKSYNME